MTDQPLNPVFVANLIKRTNETNQWIPLDLIPLSNGVKYKPKNSKKEYSTAVKVWEQVGGWFDERENSIPDNKDRVANVRPKWKSHYHNCVWDVS